MCGICGLFGERNELAIKSMIHAIKHRGPDDEGIYLDNQVSLGMTRLAVLDLSPAAHQPMCTQDGKVWIVYNGEVFNFQEEREQLEVKGYCFQSTCDVEVVLQMYVCYGDDFINRLRGMFAFAIYDQRGGSGRERLYLGRDPFGIKPLMYTWSGNTLLFASEMKALVASGKVTKTVDPDSVRLLLTFGSIYQPNTILQDVKMLPPAHRMVVEGGQSRIERYWSLQDRRLPEVDKLTYEQQVRLVAEELEDVVQMQMVSDVPIGAFLSGGVDSSILVGLMARAAGSRVKTFSVGYGAEGAHLDETEDAERTARFLGTDHTRIVVTGDDVFNRIDHIIAGLDQPSVDGINSYFVSYAARQGVTVAISGTGGDEIFAGYPWFISMAKFAQEQADGANAGFYKRWQNRLSDLPILDLLVLSKYGASLLAHRAQVNFAAKFAATYNVFGPLEAARVLHPAIRRSARAGRSMRRDVAPLDELAGNDPVNRSSALCLRGYMNNQLMRDIDAVSMSHSLEVRVPFLDRKLAELAFSLPVTAKLGRVTNIVNPYAASYRESGAKRVLVDAGHYLGLLRPDIDQQRKRGFTFPFDPWVLGVMRGLFEDALSETSVARRGLFDPQVVRLIWQDFVDRKIDWTRPWLLMITEMWCRNVLDCG